MGWVIALAVVDDASQSVLIDPAATGVTTGVTPGVARLPILELPHGEPSADQALDLIEALLDRPITPLLLRFLEADDTGAIGTGVVLTTADPTGDATAGRRFVPAAEIVETLEPEMARQHVRAWLDRVSGRADPRTPPWLEPGWHERAATWMADRLTSAGLPPTGPTRMAYQSSIGTVLRTPAAGRNFFLKCPARVFQAEASITRALAARTPGWVPEVIGIEQGEGWLLMSDLGERQLGRLPESEWADGLRRLGEIQRAWVGHREELVAAGGAHRPLARLTASLPAMLDVDGLAERVPPELLKRWTSTLPRLIDACRELEDLGIPEALIHGDAHPWNIASTERGFVVFDWSDAAFGHPFLDLAVFLRRTKDLALRRGLRDAYLDTWSGVAPHDRLERAAELAMTAGALYQVATYQVLLPALTAEDRAEFDGADVDWLQKAIDSLDRGLDSLAQALRPA